MELSSIDLSVYSMALPEEPHSPNPIETLNLVISHHRLIRARDAFKRVDKKGRPLLAEERYEAQRAIEAYQEAVNNSNGRPKEILETSPGGCAFHYLKRKLEEAKI